jgi:hypothetical protein
MMTPAGSQTTGKSLVASALTMFHFPRRSLLLRPVPKLQTIKDEDYKEWVKGLGCMIATDHHLGQTIPHHHNLPGHGSMSGKTDDTRTIPLCVHHHDEIHRGVLTFIDKYNLDLEIFIFALNNAYKELGNGN